MSRVFRKVKFARDSYTLPNIPFDTTGFSAPQEPGWESPAEAARPEAAPDPELLRKEAEELLNQAREEKERILKEAEQHAEKLKEKAFEKGFESGKQEGIKEGMALLNLEVEAHRKEFLDLVRSVEEAKDKALDELEPEVVDLSLEIARIIVKEEIRLHKDVVVNMVREALLRLAKQKNLVVRVNPEDLEMLNMEKTALMKAADLEELHILPDLRVDKGGCIVDSNGGQVDGRIEAQLDKVENTLRRLKSEGKPAQ